VGRQRHYSTAGAAARAAGPRVTERAYIPPPANDNGRRSWARVAMAGLALVLAVGMALLALQPFG
jgi:hypothetical protein